MYTSYTSIWVLDGLSQKNKGNSKTYPTSLTIGRPPIETSDFPAKVDSKLLNLWKIQPAKFVDKSHWL